MEISVSQQSAVFILSFGLGLALGFLYDIFRIFRIAVPPSQPVIFIQDALYWLFCAIAIFIFSYVTNSGQVRWFIVFGAFWGWILYYFTIGVVVYRSAKWVINVIEKILNITAKIFISPVIRIVRICRPGVRSIRKKTKYGVNSIISPLEFSVKSYKVKLQTSFRKKKKK